MKTFIIHTLGCKVNQYDSQVIREQLVRAGLREVPKNKKAHFCIINTCTVTSRADSKSRYFIRFFRRKNPKAKIIVAGCYAHSNGQDIARIDGVDAIVDNEHRNRILNIVAPFASQEGDFDSFTINEFQGRSRAFVKVQDGCNNFCSFCKVPVVRGRSRSRPLATIVKEVRNLASSGYKEIVLTGICLGDYGKDFDRKFDLVDLIEHIESIEGIVRIRLSSIEAQDVTDRLIQKMSNSAKLCPHVHIPFQSGDDGVLKRMNKKVSRKYYLELVQKMKAAVPGIGVTTDIIIGFPDEDAAAFGNTVSLVEQIIPHRVHIFTFDGRDCTPLCGFRSQSPAIKKRHNTFKKICDIISGEFKKQFLNQRIAVLCERKSRGQWFGFTGNYLETAVKSSKSDLKNQMIKVDITAIQEGRLVATQCF